ncbi:hypothetical protein IMCC21906_01085 [Spongiibacter sp. IMCC21906]|jgi:hypothetical protein|nr:hypothetical protein IMCC21906_01085 [Spongiibacter sp. IMCC21906]
MNAWRMSRNLLPLDIAITNTAFSRVVKITTFVLSKRYEMQASYIDHLLNNSGFSCYT